MSWFKKLLAKDPQKAGTQTVELREQTAEFEWFIARAELEQKNNLVHGATHLAELLTYDPARDEWLDLLRQYAEAAGSDPESLFPESEERYYATEALRAWVWHRQGRLDDAIGHLVAVTHAKPDSRYMEAWVLDWLEADGAIDQLDDNLAEQMFAVVLNRFHEAYQTPSRQLRDVRRWVALSQRKQNTGAAGSIGVMSRIGLMRKAGLFDDALKIVRPIVEHRPGLAQRHGPRPGAASETRSRGSFRSVRVGAEARQRRFLRYA